MIALTIENSTYCGARCMTCAREKMKNINQNMSDDFFFFMMDEINDWNTGQLEAISFVGMGDPLMDPGFVNKVRYIKEHTNLKIHLTNTGHMLKGDTLDAVCEYVDSVKISHYGVTEETFKKVQGGGLQLQSIVSNIDELLRRNKRPRVSMTFLMVNENQKEKDEWISRWENRCDSVDVWTPHNWGGNYGNSHGEGTPKSCKRPGRDFQIHVDGKVSVCCLDVCEDLVIGDLHEDSWISILDGEPLRHMIHLHDIGEFRKCGICWNCDLLYDRKDALIYSSHKSMRVGRKAGYSTNAVDFSEDEK